MSKPPPFEKIRRQAKDIPLIEGEVIRMPVELALAFMGVNDLEFVGFPSAGYGEVRRRRKDDINMALKETLESILERSIRTGKPQSTGKLAHGLEIKVWDFGDGRIGLVLVRDNTYPSDKEWSTVLRHFPLDVDSTEPKQILHDGRYYLRGTLRRER